ncbi:MAG TPA: hypothetical protein VK960_08920, partial [Acidimicrobiia bacterium]|nr:hypothetical protein [Acidimicrobiia bacterium]
IMEDYGVVYDALLLAVFILGVLWLKTQRSGMSWGVPSNSLLRVAGYLLLALGVFVFIDGLRSEVFDRDGGYVAGFIILVAGAAVAGFGAKQLD